MQAFFNVFLNKTCKIILKKWTTFKTFHSKTFSIHCLLIKKKTSCYRKWIQKTTVYPKANPKTRDFSPTVRHNNNKMFLKYECTDTQRLTGALTFASFIRILLGTVRIILNYAARSRKSRGVNQHRHKRKVSWSDDWLQQKSISQRSISHDFKTSFRAQDREQSGRRADVAWYAWFNGKSRVKTRKKHSSQGSSVRMYEFNEKQFESAHSRRFERKNNTSINQASDIESGSKSSQ